MNYFKRDFVCGKLSISRWQSHIMFPANGLHMVKEKDVLEKVNAASKALAPFSMVPDLITTDDLEKLTGIPASKFLLWSKRKRKPVPHVRFNSHTLRFSRAETLAWLREVGG